MIDMDDGMLSDRVLAGDDRAFEVLFGKYRASIGTFLYQLIRDREVAADLMQETFFKAWKNLRRFDRRKSFRTWLFAIARNTAFDFFKKKKELPFAAFGDDDDDAFLDIADEAILPLAILERKDIALELEEKLSGIPSGYRSVLLLHFREDFSLMEIAEMSGESYNTTKSRYLRAVRMLQKAFLSDGAPEIRSQS